MGYSTDFYGVFKLNKRLEPEHHAFLKKLSETRRMARNVDPMYGIEGELYVEDDEIGVVDHNRPPKTQPGLWCQWCPTEDGMGIEWDGGEKFYQYVEWLEYIIIVVLKPRGYVLSGEVRWSGEEQGDVGKIIVNDNKVTVSYGV